MKPQEINIKKSKGANAMAAVGSSFILAFCFVGTYKSYNQMDMIALCFMVASMGALIWASIYFWYWTFSNKIVLTINEEGIIDTKRTLSWVIIRSYQTYHTKTEDSYMEGIIITLKNGEQFKIDISDLRVEIMQLRSHIYKFCTNKSIIDEGHMEK